MKRDVLHEGFIVLASIVAIVIFIIIGVKLEQKTARVTELEKQATKLDDICEDLRDRACHALIENKPIQEIAKLSLDRNFEISQCAGASTNNFNNAIVRGTDVQILGTFSRLFDCDSDLHIYWREKP